MADLRAGEEKVPERPRHFVRMTGIADQLVLRELPFVAPTVHVDALWHHRAQRDSAHAWLRQAIITLSQPVPSP